MWLLRSGLHRRCYPGASGSHYHPWGPLAGNVEVAAVAPQLLGHSEEIGLALRWDPHDQTLGG